MATYDLLIIFTNGKEKVISGVSDYGFNFDNGLFRFEKNGYKTFLPKENIAVFGRKFDWEE